MTLPVRFHRLAENDLDTILRFIAADSSANAIDFVDRIEERCLSLGDMPYRGRQRLGGSSRLRELVFERRIVVTYRVAFDHVMILRIRYAGRETLAIPTSDDG